MLSSRAYSPPQLDGIHGTGLALLSNPAGACRAMTAQYGAANVWRGLVGGRKQVDFKTRPYSREGCFQSEAECQAFLTYVSSFLLQTFTRECRLGA